MHVFVSNRIFILAETVDLIPQFDVDLSLVSGISTRLLSSCRLSHMWCTNNRHHTLSFWNTKTYLFLSNTDLRVSSFTPHHNRTCWNTKRRENFFSRVNFVCWPLFGDRSTPMLPQWHVKDPNHSAKSAGGRLHLNMHTPLTHWSQSALTMPLSWQSVGIYQEMS